MTQYQKPFDLEARTAQFASQIRVLIRNLKQDIANIEDSKQIIRSSGSIAANYIEANEALSKKDFLMRIKICRKEAKETILWLKLLKDSSKQAQIDILIDECTQLMKIFGSIIEKTII